MKVADLMSRNPSIATPDEDVVTVARRMAEQDLGFLPVMEGRQLVGAITDRDIVIRHVAKGAGASLVRDVMTSEARCCRALDSADEALDAMGRWQLRRLPVIDEDAGIVEYCRCRCRARTRSRNRRIDTRRSYAAGRAAFQIGWPGFRGITIGRTHGGKA